VPSAKCRECPRGFPGTPVWIDSGYVAGKPGGCSARPFLSLRSNVYVPPVIVPEIVLRFALEFRKDVLEYVNICPSSGVAIMLYMFKEKYLGYTNCERKASSYYGLRYPGYF